MLSEFTQAHLQGFLLLQSRICNKLIVGVYLIAIWNDLVHTNWLEKCNVDEFAAQKQFTNIIKRTF